MNDFANKADFRFDASPSFAKAPTVVQLRRDESEGRRDAKHSEVMTDE